MIHKYYLIKNNSNNYSLFILMVTSLFSSCKMLENIRSMQQIYLEILQCCKDAIPKVGFQKLIDLLGKNNFDDIKIPFEDIKLINSCEIELLESLDFKMNIELPFKFIDLYVKPFLNEFSSQNKQLIYSKITKYICMLLCSSKVLEISPKILALVSIKLTFNNNFEIPNQTNLWMNEIIKENKEEIINNTLDLLKYQISILEPK